MKNKITKNTFLLMALTLLLPLKMSATDDVGAPAKIWTFPTVYALDEEVEWYFDMSGTGFEDGKDLYLWAWSPSEPDAGNFDNSSDFAKLQYVGDMVWKMVLTPTQYFKMSVADIENSAGFWLRLKNKGNEVQSDVISAPWSVAELRSFKESGEPAQIFPEKFYLDQPATILVNAKKLYVNGTQGAMADNAEIFMHSGLNNFADGTIIEANMGDPELVKKTKLKNIGDGIYKIDFIPREYYGAGEDFVMTNIECLFPSRDWAQVGVGEKGNIIFYAPEAIIPPDPEFYIFPQKFSQYDILTLIRKYNEASIKRMRYTIKAGDRTLTGDFAGSTSEMRAYINLLKETEGIPSLEKISLTISDQNGNEIIKTDVPLVSPKDLD